MSKTPNDPNTKTFLYILKDPETEEIRYVGKTVKKLEYRLKQHISACKREKNHRTNWILSVINKNLKPLIEQIDECKWCESQAKETYWISYYKNLGYNLVNATEGGEGNLGWIQQEETINKRKETNRKKLPKLYQYDLDGNLIKEWSSTAEAEEKLSLSSTGLCRCLKGKRKKYKNFMWSLEKHDKIEPYVRIQKCYNNKGYKHCDIAKIIKLEDNLLICNNVYLYYNNKLLFEAISLIDMVNYCKSHNIPLGNRSSIDSYKTQISDLAKTNKLYLDKYLFTYFPKDKNHIKRDSRILELELYDEKNNLICSEKGLTVFSNLTKIPKQNIINNLKGITKNVLYQNQKCTIKWKVIQNLEQLQKI